MSQTVSDVAKKSEAAQRTSTPPKKSESAQHTPTPKKTEPVQRTLIPKKSEPPRMSNKPRKGLRVFKKRRRRLVNVLDGISKPSVRRLARRAGVKRINGFVYDKVRKKLENFLTRIVNTAVVVVEHGKRTTVTPLDVVCALKHHNHTLYGF